MRKIIIPILSLVFLILTSCVEDELTDINLDGFDDTLSFCQGINGNDFVVFNTTLDPFQAILLVIPSNEMNNLIFNPTEELTENSLPINGASTRFIYRTYSDNPASVICQSVPDGDISIIDNLDSASGMINYSTTFVDSTDMVTNVTTRTITINFSVSDIDLEALRIVGEQSIGTLTLTGTVI